MHSGLLTETAPLPPLRYDIMGSFEQVQAVGAIATKEFSMLKTMEKMEAEWAGLDFKVMPYKDTGEGGGKGGGQGND